jgi:glucosamine--fructose-6-phosphate aminotransferase (isomerizing)
VNCDGFLADIVAEPEALRRVADEHGGAGLERLLDRPRILFIGMGSSRYAADTAVSALRAAGRDAHSELASTGSPQPAGDDTVALLISASGGSAETLEAAARHRGTSRVVAITNAPQSPLAGAADVALEVLAGPEQGGIACRSFACTQALLALICGEPSDTLRRAAEASASLIETRAQWVAPLADMAERAVGVWATGPAERFGSAQQSALMLREAPRIVADACETGDWLHVDVYLTKRPGYLLLLLAGSRYDTEVLGWREQREFEVVAVGREIPGASMAITFPHAQERVVAAIAETVVAELLAAELWRRHPI